MAMNAIVTAFLVVLIARDARAFLGIPDFVKMGVCKQVPIVQDFDPLKYQGLWFDNRRVPNEYQAGVRCISSTMTWTGQGLNVSSKGETADGDATFQEAMMTSQSKGSGHPKVDPKDAAAMYVDAQGVPNAPYKVMWTDYVYTACVYSCLEYFSAFRAEFFWIISRTEKPSQVSVQTCLDLFTSLHIDVNRLALVEQGDSCNYYSKLEEDRKKTEQLLKTFADSASLSEANQEQESPASPPAKNSHLSAPKHALLPPPELIGKDHQCTSGETCSNNHLVSHSPDEADHSNTSPHSTPGSASLSLLSLLLFVLR